ncbi:MAG: glycosyltransferase [Clostridia bacterium]
MKEFNFKLEPGRKLYNNREYVETFPLISVIVPFYNSEKFIEQTIKSILNQTFPSYEILIIDDGSTNKMALEKLEQIKELDKRIKVFHKQNEGLATTRDYGASKSDEHAKYLMFIDDDDLIEPTFLECGFWTLETNKDAAWAYSDSLGFGSIEYTWNKYFSSEKMKKENDLISAALVRKTDFFLVNGYNLKEKAVNEDWNFWLKLLSKEKFPVHISFYGEWYRRKENGELQRSRENKERSLEIINNTAKGVTKEIKAKQYPCYNYNYELIEDNLKNIEIPKRINKKDTINILFIIPWMVTGGADLFNLSLVKGLNKERYEITIISTEPNENVLRQEFENNENVRVYDLTSFLDKRYWVAFVNYIIQKENINLIFNSNSKTGYSMLPYIKSMYPEIPILDYVHMEEWYNRNGGYSRYSSMYNSIIDKTMVCNENSKKILEEHFKRNSDEVQTVYIGVDEEKFNPDRYNKEELEKKYLGDTTNKKIISFICRISEQKRPLLFLEIIKKLKEKRQDFKVLVVGDGNLLGKMKEKAKKMNLLEDIIFFGEIKNTGEIYKISNVTVNCSLKEGLALTSYESLSMNVPIVSSDVGGQKELISKDVGEIVKLMQNEEDVYLEKYSPEEINSYVKAINKVLDNLETYKSNCRKRICENFTISKMIEKMDSIFEETHKNPSKKKIENAYGLSKNKDITKELITANFKSDELEYKWECSEYERKVYGKNYSAFGLNSRKELLKEKLWQVPAWRFMIKIYHKIR